MKRLIVLFLVIAAAWCLSGCGVVSSLQKSLGVGKDAKNTDYNAAADIAGLDGAWTATDDSVVIVFREGNFQFKEMKDPEKSVIGTYKIINDSTVEGQLPGKPLMRFTDVKVTGNSMTLKLDGKTIVTKRLY